MAVAEQQGDELVGGMCSLLPYDTDICHYALTFVSLLSPPPPPRIPLFLSIPSSSFFNLKQLFSLIYIGINISDSLVNDTSIFNKGNIEGTSSWKFMFV